MLSTPLPSSSVSTTTSRRYVKERQPGLQDMVHSNLSSGCSTQGSFTQGAVDEQVDANIMDFHDDELVEIFPDLEFVEADDKEYDVNNPQPVNQPDLNQTHDQLGLNPQLSYMQPAFNQGVSQFQIYHTGFHQPNLHHSTAISEAGIPAVNHPDLPADNDYAHEGNTVRNMMEEDNHGVNQGYTRSHEHAAQLEAEYLAITATKLASGIKPESLVDIPRTEEARAIWRERIFYAITDIDNVVNKDRKKVGVDKKGNRIENGTVVNTHVRRVRNLGGFERELMADKILKWTVEAHEGNPGIPPWCEDRSWNLEQFPTFHARMEAVLQALRTNKSVPHSYIQVDTGRRFVAAPKRDVRVKKDNMDGNEKKGGLIDEGWQARQKAPQGN